jgi:RNA polymerase sigma factor (sigma-70 family)
VGTDDETTARSQLDDAAFGRLFDRHSRVLFLYLARRIDDAVAEDLLSETFLVAFERRGALDPGRGDALPWLFGIATNLLRRHRRQELRAYRAYARSVDLDTDDTELSDDRIDMNAALADVARALEHMPRAVHETVLLFAWAELTYEQISAAMGVPIGTVRSRLNRARTALRTVPGVLATLRGENHG